jgi:hypothetical protein
VSSNDSGSRTTYKDQIHVDGEFGTRTVKRDDEPDIGIGKVSIVVSFDGVVNYKDDALMSPVSVSDDESEAFLDDVEERLSELEVHDFEEGE